MEMHMYQEEYQLVSITSISLIAMEDFLRANENRKAPCPNVQCGESKTEQNR